MEKLGYRHVAWVTACSRIRRKTCGTCDWDGWVTGAYIFAMIPPLRTYSLVPDIWLGVARLQGYFPHMCCLGVGKDSCDFVEASKAGLHGACIYIAL